MKIVKLLIWLIILSPVLCFGQTYDFSETFDGSSYCSGGAGAQNCNNTTWETASGSDITWNNTTMGSVSGVYNAKVDSSTVTNHSAIKHPVSNITEITGFFLFRFHRANTQTGDSAFWCLYDPTYNNSMVLYFTTTGALRLISHTANLPTTDVMSEDTDYCVYYHWKNGAGAGAVSAEFSLPVGGVCTAAGSGTKYVSASSVNITEAGYYVYYYGRYEANGITTTYFDKILENYSSTAIGSVALNPSNTSSLSGGSLTGILR